MFDDELSIFVFNDSCDIFCNKESIEIRLEYPLIRKNVLMQNVKYITLIMYCALLIFALNIF